MAKNIVFCADGTWNGPAQPNADTDGEGNWPTNVLKLFQNLAGRIVSSSADPRDEQEKVSASNGTITQAAKYMHGVGDSKNQLAQWLGGSIGAGLITRIVRGFTFISRNYVPGDKIFITGFSRGAYTARALAGMIAAKGLLDASKLNLNDKEQAYQWGSAQWYDWRQSVLQNNGGLVQNLEAECANLPYFLLYPPDPATLITNVPMNAVAVWDTVGALGIPDYNKDRMRIDVFQFADTKLSTQVSYGFQALAIDERRSDFTPTLWDSDGARIAQGLFVGCHSDVGGGYCDKDDAAQDLKFECGLSDEPLRWMIGNLAALGVEFAAVPSYAVRPSATGPAHEPWSSGIWAALPQWVRIFPPGYGLSAFVPNRMSAGLVYPDPAAQRSIYIPGNLTAYLNGNEPAAGVTIISL